MRQQLATACAACILLAVSPANAAEIRTYRSSNAPFIDRTYGTDTTVPSFNFRIGRARTSDDARERHFFDRYGYHGNRNDARNRIIVPQAHRAPAAECGFMDERRSSEGPGPAYRCRLR